MLSTIIISIIITILMTIKSNLHWYDQQIILKDCISLGECCGWLTLNQLQSIDVEKSVPCVGMFELAFTSCILPHPME
jgi:hypothetical protein